MIPNTQTSNGLSNSTHAPIDRAKELAAAAERYLADTTAEVAAALAQAADPPRQELLRRMNMAPGGTGALIAMRSELATHLRDEPELKLLDADLKHLFASWFNRGFLELRRIDWQSPAAVLADAEACGRKRSRSRVVARTPARWLVA